MINREINDYIRLMEMKKKNQLNEIN